MSVVVDGVVLADPIHAVDGKTVISVAAYPGTMDASNGSPCSPGRPW